jgi:hypothetical protein
MKTFNKKEDDGKTSLLFGERESPKTCSTAMPAEQSMNLYRVSGLPEIQLEKIE